MTPEWRGRMGVEPTGAGITGAHTVLKTIDAAGGRQDQIGEGAWESNPPAPGSPAPTRF